MTTSPDNANTQPSGAWPTYQLDPQFDQCATGHRPTGLINFLWRWGEGRTQLCQNPEPWWTNMWFTVAIACTAAFAVQLLNAPNLVRGAVVIAGFVFALVVTDVINPRNHHAWCELCGQCATGAGVPPARNRRAAAWQLRAHGWTQHPLDQSRAHCKGHSHVPFTNPF